MKASEIDTMEADQVVCPGDGYCLLDPDEIVKEGDEVLNQFLPGSHMTNWTTEHTYYGRTVDECYGGITNAPRFFRRKVQAEQIDIAPKILKFRKK